MKEEKKVFEIPYETKIMKLGKADMDLIELPNQRHIRNTQVNSILRALREGKHFESMFVVNVNNGIKKIRVIDGGHRTYALKKYFEDSPNDKIEVNMAIYKDLTESQEREVYRKWNIGAKQSIDDFIHSYRVEIPEYNTMITELPASVYGSHDQIKIRYIVDAYLSSKKKPFLGGMTYSAMQWLDEFKKITYDDISSMKNTFEILNEVFNKDKINDFVRLPAFKTAVFRALFCLIGNNKVILGKNYVIKRMKTILSKSSELIQFKGHSRYVSMDAYDRFKLLLNRDTEHKFE